MSIRYAVTVENVGQVHEGDDLVTARLIALEYHTALLADDAGRAEWPVVLWDRGEILTEYDGRDGDAED
jgi:hypothetical protein